MPGRYQNREPRTNISQFLHIQFFPSAVKHPSLVCMRQHLHILLEQLTQEVLLCEAGTFHGKLQPPQSHHTEGRPGLYKPAQSLPFLSTVQVESKIRSTLQTGATGGVQGDVTRINANLKRLGLGTKRWKWDSRAFTTDYTNTEKVLGNCTGCSKKLNHCRSWADMAKQSSLTKLMLPRTLMAPSARHSHTTRYVAPRELISFSCLNTPNEGLGRGRAAFC